VRAIDIRRDIQKFVHKPSARCYIQHVHRSFPNQIGEDSMGHTRIVTLLVQSLVICAFASQSAAASKNDWDDEQIKGIQAADRRAVVQAVASLTKMKAMPAEMKAHLDEQIAAIAEHTDDDSKWVKLYKTVIDAAEAGGAECKTTVKTSNPGATIKFQLVGKKTVTTAGEPTNKCTESVTFGVYHVWAERDDKSTSSTTNNYRLLQAEKTLELGEK
jgi:hypothetical protein